MTSAAPAGIAKRGSIPEAFAAEGAAEKTPDKPATHKTLWERACSRKRPVSRYESAWYTAFASRLAPTGLFIFPARPVIWANLPSGWLERARRP